MHCGYYPLVQRLRNPLAAHQDDTLTRDEPCLAHFPLADSRKGEGSIWQRRFWEHTIRDDDDFARHIDYIHFNPVKHSYVERVHDWPFSRRSIPSHGAARLLRTRMGRPFRQ